MAVHGDLIHAVVMTLNPLRNKPRGPENVKRLSAAARVALDISAKLSGIAHFVPRKDINGVPLPAGSVFWSISHTEQCVAGVVAPQPVGIDLEKIGPVSDDLWSSAASEEEWNLASAGDPSCFFRYWTAKEAVLKATGAGLAGLRDCIVTGVTDAEQIRLSYRGRNWTVYQRRIADGRFPHIAAVTGGGSGIVWHIRAEGNHGVTG
ncbi:MAG: 4'-phosphopantetheinyl transferase superfamily protein [Desulfofustis sp.]|jgi:4'-phosphopantetheinyl transferase|nr:4'-phosphopantetheinyl transferase superfamily protein [Desulfofustis sp.]